MLMSSGDREAVLMFGPNGFRVVKPGKFVSCGITGEPILLEELRYWSIEYQEAYASPEIATRRLAGGE